MITKISKTINMISFLLKICIQKPNFAGAHLHADFSHGHRRRRAVSFRLRLTEEE